MFYSVESHFEFYYWTFKCYCHCALNWFIFIFECNNIIYYLEYFIFLFLFLQKLSKLYLLIKEINLSSKFGASCNAETGSHIKYLCQPSSALLQTIQLSYITYQSCCLNVVSKPSNPQLAQCSVEDKSSFINCIKFYFNVSKCWRPKGKNSMFYQIGSEGGCRQLCISKKMFWLKVDERRTGIVYISLEKYRHIS